MDLVVPKDRVENLRFRQVLLERARGSREMREVLWITSSRNLLFWVNVFGWTYDPRLVKDDLDPVVPWITWDYQDDALGTIERSIGKHPLLIEKSRDMGATWMLMAVYTHQWLFRKNRSFLLASRTEDLVDARGDTDTLFWKIEFLLKHLPEWMVPQMERTALHMHNQDRQNVIDGSSTNDDLGRGGRRTGAGYDEFPAVDKAHEVHSASSSLTENPIFMGTHKGVGTKFFALSKTQMPKLRLHWTVHPKKSAGMYRSDSGVLVILDTEYKFPEGYPFILDGKIRSPWYDSLKTIFGMTDQQIAAEVDIDPEGSDFGAFPEADMGPLERDIAQDGRRGILEVNADEAEPLAWTDSDDGPFELWLPLFMGKSPPGDREYVVGVDISAGVGSSNSAICVGDCVTGEQVMEYANPRIKPEALARLAVAICRWFQGDDGRGAFLIWESTGPTGANFGQEVIALGYRNVYYQTREDDLSATTTTKFGYAANTKSKNALLGNLLQGMVARRFKVRSRQVYRECRGYTYENGNVVYSGARQGADPTNAGAAHGDRVIAAGMCWHRMRVMVGKDPLVAMERKIPVGSLAWRRQLVEAEHRESDGTEQW